jgi:hypothetical protein
MSSKGRPEGESNRSAEREGSPAIGSAETLSAARAVAFGE